MIRVFFGVEGLGAEGTDIHCDDELEMVVVKKKEHEETWHATEELHAPDLNVNKHETKCKRQPTKNA